MKELKTAMIGGSYDPVHLGHLFLLHCAVQLTDYERIILVPANLSNFKQTSVPIASDKQRLEMLNLGLSDYYKLYPNDRKVTITVSDAEIKRGGISYTYDTVLELKKDNNLSNRMGLIMGDDVLKDLDKWFNFRKLSDEVSFVVCRREKIQPITSFPKYVDIEFIDGGSLAPQSSTAVRQQEELRKRYLSPSVEEYVRANNLYC